MKTVGTVLLVVGLLLPWCAASGQQNDTPAPAGDKKIVITKRTVDADGTETTETIIKKGKAADNFDVDAYLRENEKDNVSIRIREESNDGDDIRIITSGDERRLRTRNIVIDIDGLNETVRETDRALNDAFRTIGDSFSWSSDSGDETRAFLGVEEDSDEDSEAEGLVVEVIRCSAAEKAGLRDNDKILKLNDTKINNWRDLTGFVQKAKPGDKVSVTYQRNGATQTAEATLSTRKEVNKECADRKEERGFLGVSPEDDDDDEDENEKDDPGIEVEITEGSAADKAGLKDGDEILKLDDTDISDWEDIEDFMSNTKAGDKVRVTYERGGKTHTAEAVLAEKKSSVEAVIAPGMMNWNGVAIDSREKDACLGVYTHGIGKDAKEGAAIDDFTSESPARDASMAVGDVITSINGANVRNHDELWNEIAKFNPGDKVKVEYLREQKTMSVEATLKACKDQNRVSIITRDDAGPKEQRRFYTWGWNENERERLRTRRIITIHKSQEGDGSAAPAESNNTQDRTLKLNNFRAFPNPSAGPVTVEFSGESVATVVSLLDMNGRQLFREELNAFNGDYNQQFDLSEYAKGTIIIHIQQGDKVFTEQLVVN